MMPRTPDECYTVLSHRLPQLDGFGDFSQASSAGLGFGCFYLVLREASVSTCSFPSVKHTPSSFLSHEHPSSLSLAPLLPVKSTICDSW